MSHFSDQYITDCDSRTSDDDYLDRRDGVSSVPVLPAAAKSKPTYDKIITPTFEQNGKHKHLTGYTGELYDGNILLHSQSYDTNSQAEQALDRIVYDLLTDLAEQGLVDDVPAALEAEQVSSTHLPSWQESPHAPSLTQAIALGLVGTPDPVCELCNAPAFVWCDGQIFCQAQWQQGECLPVCANTDCKGPHHTWQCPQIGDLLFAEPVVMVPDVEYAPFGFAA